jgi:hypothetical protein
MTTRARPSLVRTSLLAMLVTLVLITFAMPSAGAETAAPITVSLVSISPQVRGNDALRIELQAPGAVGADSVRVVIFDRARDGAARATLRKVVDGTESPRATQGYNAIVEPVSKLTDPSRQTLVLTVTSDRLPQTPGVYPIQITVGVSKPLITWLVRLGAGSAGDVPYTVSFVVPVRSPIADQPDGTSMISPTEVSRLDGLASVIERAPSGSMTVVPNPETLDALNAGDPTANAALVHLQKASKNNAVLAAPFVPVDIDAWRRAGREDYVSLLLRQGRDSLTKSLGRNPTDISSRTVVLDGYDTPASLDTLRREGAINAIVPDTQLEGLRSTAFPSPFAQTFRIRDSGNQDLLAASADTWLSKAVVDLDRSTDPSVNAQQILADLAAGFFDNSSTARGSVILLPDNWAPGATSNVVTSLLAPLATSSVVQLRSIDGFFDTVSRSSPDTEKGMETLISGPMRRNLISTRGPDVDSLSRDLDQARSTLASYESIFGAAAATHATKFDDLLVASADDRLTDAQHRAYIDAATSFVTRSVRTSTGKIAISAPESERFTLTSRHEKIRIVIENDLTSPATVRIDLRSEKLTFPQGESINTTLQPGSNVIQFDVSVKTSGDSLLEYTVNAPKGSLGELARGKLRVRALALSGLGVVLSAVALLVIITWWFRHARRSRREKRALVATTS